MSYCHFANALPADTQDPNKHYHDTQYGFPIDDDNALFGRLLLEINQAGLSWSLMLKKADNFYRAYAGFDIAKVAAFTEQDRTRLLQDAGIVRNRLKINAAIVNAQRIMAIQQEYGSFKQWLDNHHPLTLAEWIKLFKKNFKFVGGEIVNEFLMSIGYLAGAHQEDCPIYQHVLTHNPAWLGAK
ncbi:MAG: DNA-3-methyladenine glycosylase I [Pelistega sp.]|nr:DNA-3-methyladenine glycosylase I [Pelistega sp.]